LHPYKIDVIALSFIISAMSMEWLHRVSSLTTSWRDLKEKMAKKELRAHNIAANR